MKRHQHLCQVDPLSPPSTPHPASASYTITPMVRHLPLLTTGVQHSRGIQVDPDNLLPPGFKDRFYTLLDQYDEVFNPAITGYNGAVGPFESKVNMGPVESPQRKGRLPLYGRDKLTELQQKFDELESLPRPRGCRCVSGISQPFLPSQKTEWRLSSGDCFC